ncbi:MAG TPA: hypothetical protein VGO52_14775 [Hyphomonadaceae bacterium]|nr:hypothetical protein [Hyphomonadaceae bacterium]
MLAACFLLAGCNPSVAAVPRESDSGLQMSGCVTIDGAQSQRELMRSFFSDLKASRQGRFLEEPQWLYYKAEGGELYIHYTDRMKMFPNLIAIYGDGRKDVVKAGMAALALFLNNNKLSTKDCSKRYFSAITPYDIN